MMELGQDILQYGAGIAALVVAVAAWAKLKAHNSASNAESDLYDNLRQENERLSVRLSDTSIRLDGEIDAHRQYRIESEKRFASLKSECESDRREMHDQINLLDSRLKDLYEAVNKYQKAEADQKEVTLKVISGELPDRRKAGQPPRGRRSPR